MNNAFPTVEELEREGNVQYFDVNGVPVAVLDEVEPIRYDTNPPSAFAYGSVFNDGVEIDRAAFLGLIAKKPRRRA
jgi:hypothetical protein